MLPKMFKSPLRIAAIILLVVLLALVRAYEDVLFYDPFVTYFKGDYLNKRFPAFDAIALFFGMTFRYLLNSVLSLAIIQLLFSDKRLTKFATILYFLLFAVLIITFFLVVEYTDNTNNFFFFYVRRFLIQPLFLLLFVPAFFYQKQQHKK